jgi:hypothetical protein
MPEATPAAAHMHRTATAATTHTHRAAATAAADMHPAATTTRMHSTAVTAAAAVTTATTAVTTSAATMGSECKCRDEKASGNCSDQRQRRFARHLEIPRFRGEKRHLARRSFRLPFPTTIEGHKGSKHCPTSLEPCRLVSHHGM